MMMRGQKHNAGFSLLELLLSMGVFFAMMMAIFMLLQTYAERELARSANKYMASVADATRDMLSNVDNFNALYAAAVAAGGGYQLIADASAPAQDNIAKDFQVGGIWIQGSRTLNARFGSNSPLRSPVRILLRVADDPSISTDIPAFDMMVVTSTPRPDSVVRRAASEGGASGGYIRTYSSKSDAEVVNSFGSWKFALGSGLQSTTWYSTELRSSLNSQIDGSYLAYYKYVNLEDVGGDYLYRVKDFDPTLKRNTMYGDFNIGGNDIYGGDNINIGNSGSAKPFTTSDADPGVPADCKDNVLCVNGTGIVKGSGTIGGMLTTEGSALIADSAGVRNMRLQNGLSDTQKSDYGAQSMFVVDGNGNDGGGNQDEIDVTHNAKFVDGATVNAGNLKDTTGVTLTMPDGGIYNTKTITNTRRVSGTTVNAKDFVVNDQLKAGIVQGGDVTAVQGRSGVIDIRQSRDLIYGAAGTNRTITAPKISIGEMNISTFGNCVQGCGSQ